jgi:hypothetical protein
MGHDRTKDGVTKETGMTFYETQLQKIKTLTPNELFFYFLQTLYSKPQMQWQLGHPLWWNIRNGGFLQDR